ncbi:alpha/beta hydrolase [Polaribacter undariae]|uniref:Alpha/beta hydrolase n=1 Tax=Polaribacter sejongensis TaxID=985043 RepID=A0AAJ1QWS8_9FLAO|nr:alpha/beta hydrolase [Polaribacter undariae]MDN3619774.1 alpha/beta hydrolase [Polaribacter undariae]UWD31540.1 alpha/beta hydrolase [Polaribacter undariae]
MKQFTLVLIIIASLFGCKNTTEKNEKQFFLPPATTYNYVEIDSVKLFYREAGDKSNPTIVLLHGYPSSSHSYRNLIPMLATHYHVIAPDNLGSGYSTHLDPEMTTYTFDLLSSYTQKLIDTLQIKNYVMYMQDFGAPVGYRMMMKKPKRIEALIVQNANAYLEGLTPKRQDFFRTAQTDTSQAKHDFLYSLTSKEAIINKQYLFDLDSTNINIQSPDAWTHDLAFLRSQKDREIQVQLFKDYNTNLIRYPKWQKMLKENQPKTLITWGRKDLKFNANGARAYLKDLPNAELHLLDAGHFAAEEKTREVAKLILEFLSKNEIE